MRIKNLHQLSFYVILGMLGFLFSFADNSKAHEIVVVIDDKGVPMVYVPGDTFQMGASLDEAVAVCAILAPDDYEYTSQTCSQEAFEEFSLVSPAQTVEVESFYIDQYEVSLGNYLDCVNADVCTTDFLRQEMERIDSGDDVPMDVPVSNASYYYAAVYCHGARRDCPRRSNGNMRLWARLLQRSPGAMNLMEQPLISVIQIVDSWLTANGMTNMLSKRQWMHLIMVSVGLVFTIYRVM